VQVTGVPDPKMGEEIMAWVKPRAGAVLSADDVREFCRVRIAHFKVPRYVRFIDEFPMTISGKVQKFRMREMAREQPEITEVTTP
jgi:fatty-acyl-CoA synthase